MGCKCANSNEEEEEIQKKALEDGNAENTNIDFNKNFNQNEDLLGLNNQENLYQEDVQKIHQIKKRQILKILMFLKMKMKIMVIILILMLNMEIIQKK